MDNDKRAIAQYLDKFLGWECTSRVGIDSGYCSSSKGILLKNGDTTIPFLYLVCSTTCDNAMMPPLFYCEQILYSKKSQLGPSIVAPNTNGIQWRELPLDFNGDEIWCSTYLTFDRQADTNQLLTSKSSWVRNGALGNFIHRATH